MPPRLSEESCLRMFLIVYDQGFFLKISLIFLWICWLDWIQLDKNRSAKSSEVQINVGMYKGNEYGKR